MFARYPSLKDRVVLVTGGASGIGAEIVRAFAAQGSRVGFVDLEAALAGSLVEELGATGSPVAFEPCDLRDVDGLRRAFAALAERLGDATVLVNNAARDDRHPWQEVTPEYYDERIATSTGEVVGSSRLREGYYAACRCVERAHRGGRGTRSRLVLG